MMSPSTASADERISRMRRRYQTEMPRISVERARLYTEKWRELESSDSPLPVRTALAMKHVYEYMTHHIDPDDRLAGAWTEFFLGFPIDIERGLFNGVFEHELDKHKMLRFQLKSYWNFLLYMLRRRGLRGLWRNVQMQRRLGPTPVNIGLKTLPEREVNPFSIDPPAKRELQRNLLPYWKGRCIADVVADEITHSDLFGGDMADFAAAVPTIPTKQALIISLGASIATYQGHLVLDHEKPLRQGLLAMREEVRDLIKANAEAPAEERNFLRSVEIGLDGLILFAERLADAVEAELQRTNDFARREILTMMLAVCRKVPLHPAETFHEAVQALWTLRTAVEVAHPTNVHSYGRLDQVLLPYYRADLDVGRITTDQARELLEELLLKIMTQNIRPESNMLGNFYLRYEGSTPVTLGGVDAHGEDATNELTYLLLEAADRSKTVTSIVVRVHQNTPEKLYLQVADILRRGTSNLSMMNDDLFVPAMERHGYSPESARNYGITGCTDLLAPGETGGISFCGLLLSRVLDITLRNGDGQTLLGPLRNVGIRTGDPDTFENFAQLLDAFEHQIDHMVKVNVDASDLRDRLFAERQPAPILSAFIAGCLENKKDITRGGARYNMTGINMINSVANVVDSLYVIKKLIFEEKRFTFHELLVALDEDFHGHDDLLRRIKAVEGRWGNGNGESDELAREVIARLFATCDKYRCYKGGPVAPFINSMTSHTMDGRVSGATPDGRRAATPYASSCNPYNVERAGITGVLRSVAALDYRPLLGCAVNVRLHPSFIGENEQTQKKFTSLLRTYFRMGGVQLQPTVASAEMLRAAQRSPDDYRELIVKVGGYSTYFVDLGREIQNEVIARTEHGAVE